MIPGGLNNGRPAAVGLVVGRVIEAVPSAKIPSGEMLKVALIEELVRLLGKLEKLDSLEVKMNQLLFERPVKKSLWDRLTNFFKRNTNQ